MLFGILELQQERYDYILIDICLSLECLTINARAISNEVIIVVPTASGYDGDAGFSAGGGEALEADQSDVGDCGYPDEHVRVHGEAV